MATKEPKYVAPNPKKLQAQAQAQVSQEISAQVDPLQSLVDTYQNQSNLATEQLDQLYTDPNTGLQPAVERSTENLRSDLSQITGAQKSIFSEANARLNSIRQTQAADAQTLAQQLGTPIPVSMFAQPVDEALGYAAAEFGGGMLNALGLASSGVQQAEAFSGQVFPMMRSRQTAEVKSFFREKMSALESEIASIKGQKRGLVSKRQRDLLVQDREFALTRLQADRDMYMARQELNERRRALELEYDKLDATIAEADKDRAATVAAQKQKEKLDAKQAYMNAQDNALKYLDAMFTPGSTKVTIQTGIDADGNPKYEDVIQPGQPMTDPNRVMEKIMSAAGVNKDFKKNRQFVQWLEKQIRIRGTSEGRDWDKVKWVYGQGVDEAGNKPTSTESGAKSLKYFKGLSLNNLDKLAKSTYGFKGNYPKNMLSEKQRKEWLAAWVWRKQEAALAESIPGDT